MSNSLMQFYWAKGINLIGQPVWSMYAKEEDEFAIGGVVEKYSTPPVYECVYVPWPGLRVKVNSIEEGKKILEKHAVMRALKGE